jgi:hypothetical protein
LLLFAAGVCVGWTHTQTTVTIVHTCTKRKKKKDKKYISQGKTQNKKKKVKEKKRGKKERVNQKISIINFVNNHTTHILCTTRLCVMREKYCRYLI